MPPTTWPKPTPQQIAQSRKLAGFERVEDAAKAFGINRRTWYAWEQAPTEANHRQMPAQSWLLWQILTGQIQPTDIPELKAPPPQK